MIYLKKYAQGLYRSLATRMLFFLCPVFPELSQPLTYIASREIYFH